MANIALNRFLFNKLVSNKCLVLRKKPELSKELSRKSGGFSHKYHPERLFGPNRAFLYPYMLVMTGSMWCYIFWSFRHNWRELVGEYIWPQRSEWSNEHLGVPDDDYEGTGRVVDDN